MKAKIKTNMLQDEEREMQQTLARELTTISNDG